MKHTGKQGLKTVSLIALCAWPGQTAIAQDQDGGGLELTLDFGQYLRASDNYNFVANPSGDTFLARTDLAFGLSSKTNAQSFDLSFGGAFEAGDFPDSGGSDSDFVDEFLRFSYTREAASSRFYANGRFNHFDLTTLDIDDDFDGTDLIVDVGTRDTYRFGTGIETGIGGPFGVKLDASYNKRDFSDTTDPDLFDRETTKLDGVARFQVSPVTELRVLAGLSEYDAENAASTERTRTYFGVGASFDVSPALRFSTNLRQNRIETTESGVTTTTDGLSADLGVTMDRPNGTIFSNLSTSYNTTGRRDSFSLGRSVELPRGALSYSLGVTDSDSSDPNLTATVSYEQELPRGGFNLSLTRAGVSDNDDNEALRTRLSMGYQQSINASSSWDARLSYADYDVLSGTGTDTRRTSLSLSYRQELTREWDLRVGYEYAHSLREAQPTRKSNTVFVGLERSFSFFP